MSLLVAFDTSTPEGAVAIGRGEHVLAERRVGSSVRQSESLLPAIAEVLEEGGLQPSDLTGVVVGSGPGSFTGVRVAAATARGLVRGLGIPLLAYGSLLAEAAAAGHDEVPVCALFDARRGEVYAACFRFGGSGWDTLLEPQAAPLADVVAGLATQRPAWTGEGATRHADELPSPPVPPVMSRAAALLRLAALAPERGLLPAASAWEPDYLRPPGAERLRG